MESGREGIKRYVEGKCDSVYELWKYNFDGAERYELTEEQVEKIRENLGLGEKSSKIGASPEYNEICKVYCKYYDHYCCDMIKEWQLKEECNRCDIYNSKETPMKLIWLEEKIEGEEDDILFTGWHCPTCKGEGTYQAIDEYHGDYCPYCGQRIDMPKSMRKDGYKNP